MSRPQSAAFASGSGQHQQPNPDLSVLAGRGDSAPLRNSRFFEQLPPSEHFRHGSAELDYGTRLSEPGGYPSWIPDRPPPPAPASTFSALPSALDDRTAMDTPVDSIGPDDSLGRTENSGVGRRPTTRSVRIVSIPADAATGDETAAHRQSRKLVDNHPRASRWSRGTTPAVNAQLRQQRPRFRAPALHVELLRNPSPWTRLRFYLYPLFVFAHIPVQTFFDFNAVFVLIQVSKFPNPVAPGVPGSGRNWALGAAAYIGCWVVWIFIVSIVYELIYSFYRLWRVKRPLILPIYLSSAAFNYACMTSYNNFCFVQNIRAAALPKLPFSVPFIASSTSSPTSSPVPKTLNSSWQDYLAETFYFYSQNLPTVALLLPRAGLCLALLFAFSSPQPAGVALGNSGMQQRDGTYFRRDGALTDYAKGVLIANAVWTAWRTLVLIVSCIGLWILSGQAFGGLCGPRYRWEEDDLEKRVSVISNGSDDTSPGVPWSWKECTRIRVQDAYEFCLTSRPPRWSVLQPDEKKLAMEGSVWGTGQGTSEGKDEGLERTLAVIGLPSSSLPPRRGILNNELFEAPVGDRSLGGLSDILPPVTASPPSAPPIAVAGPSGPLMALPYPFTGYPAQTSSETPLEKIPFPPSPTKGKMREDSSSSEDEASDEEDIEELDKQNVTMNTISASTRASGSMSSLGRPIPPGTPLHFMRNVRPRGAPRSSMGTRRTESSSSRSGMSKSTGNEESTSGSSRESRSVGSSPVIAGSSSPIPMPPRRERRRERTSTSVSLPQYPSPVVYSDEQLGVGRMRAESDSGASRAFAPQLMYESDGGEGGPSRFVDGVQVVVDEGSAEGSQEEAEKHDRVGLLSSSPSPRNSFGALKQRGSGGLSPQYHHHPTRRGRHNSGSSTGGSRTGSSSRSVSLKSRSISMGSRVQSLIQSLGAASRSSLSFDLGVRSRASSMIAPVEEGEPSVTVAPGGLVVATTAGNRDSGTSASVSSPSSEGRMSRNEDHTFGQPMRLGVDIPPITSDRAPQQQLQVTQVPSQKNSPASSNGDARPTSLSSKPQSPVTDPRQSFPPASATSDYHSVLSGDGDENVGTLGPDVEITPVATQPIPIPRPRVASASTTGRAALVSPHPQSFVSTANESFVTAQPGTEGSSDSTAVRPGSSWGEMGYVADAQAGTGGGNWRPA